MIIAIIQARISSQRLPGKVLMDICGKSMLERVIERTQKSSLIDNIIVAMPLKGAEYNLLVPLTIKCGVSYYLHRNEEDVLGRYYQACPPGAKAVVRITADCPLIDPMVIDRTVQYYMYNDIDYVYNVPPYPDGLDVEVFSYNTLFRLQHMTLSPYDREHVTTYVRSHPELFRIGQLDGIPYPRVKWSVDTEADLEVVRRTYHNLGPDFTFEDLLRFGRKNEAVLRE